MSPGPGSDLLVGVGLGLLTGLVMLREWGLLPEVTRIAAPVLVILVTAVLGLQVRKGRQGFIVVALGLSALAVATLPDWGIIIERGLNTAAFIAAFFTALATLRNAADSSPAIRRCGRFLSQQPPGRRYAALTVGGQLFALVLNYGSIVLLGSLALANAGQETNPEIRYHRTRRMLLAIQRGFISSLAWSPLSFAVAITSALIPQATWLRALLPCLVTGAIVAGTGWLMDTVFKPRLSGPRPIQKGPEDSAATLLPLLFLLLILGGSVGLLHFLFEVRVVGAVIVVVPLIALVWVGLQAARGQRLRSMGSRARGYLGRDLPGYRGELVLLMMAGFIGTVGAQLLVPRVEAMGLDLGALPPWLILISLVWIIPLAGQLGMNPILAVSLIAPLLPSAEAMGVTPVAVFVAITAGWSLSGASSPFTATTLLIGSFAGISATRVGIQWNGIYTLTCAVALSAWVWVYAFVL
ncbi:membrane protein [Loktanella sp. 22II-4b]|nr:membrane protein [Loktanella sp. 22II-4b]